MASSNAWIYNLIITIHGGEKLSIADITTSDPYVIVFVGERNIGKTQTIYRNHSNPSWEKTFDDIKLLHRSVVFHTFDKLLKLTYAVIIW